MKIKDGFLLRRFADDYVVVAVGDGAEEFNKLITLNAVGKFIYDLLLEGNTRDGVVDAVLEKYEIDRETAERDADVFISGLRSAGLLDE